MDVAIYFRLGTIVVTSPKKQLKRTQDTFFFKSQTPSLIRSYNKDLRVPGLGSHQEIQSRFSKWGRKLRNITQICFLSLVITACNFFTSFIQQQTLNRLTFINDFPYQGSYLRSTLAGTPSEKLQSKIEIFRIINLPQNMNCSP